MLVHQHLVQRKNVEHFYDDIKRAMADVDSKYKIITGDFTQNIISLQEILIPKN